MHVNWEDFICSSEKAKQFDVQLSNSYRYLLNLEVNVWGKKVPLRKETLTVRGLRSLAVSHNGSHITAKCN